MADKLQQGVNVLTTFVDGETPTAAKLNSITAQLKNASQQLERAVGDIHGQSYPYSSASSARLSIAYGRSGTLALTNAETRSLDIVNLARLIGPASALNPMILGNDLEITEPVPAGVTEFSLRYPPENILGVSFTKNGTGEAFQSRQNVVDLQTAGQFHVDSLGRVYTTQETDSVDPGSVTYTINRSSWFGGPNYEGGRFNVIPDPNQLSAGGSGCSISSPPDAQGRRTITLPTATHAQFDVDMDSVQLDDADPNYQSQLLLPQVITSTYTSGQTIPEGFLLLKNWTTGEVYDTAEYTYLGENSLQIGNVDITTEVDRGDVFCIITVGTDITTAIDDLRRKSRHAHDRAFGEPLVPAESITDWTAGPWGSRGSFTKSEIEGNYAPQYLHRYGYQSGENGWNDQNIMRGTLVLGRSGASEGGYLDSSGSSYSVYFGDVANGPRLYNNNGSYHIDVGAGDWDVDVSANWDCDVGGQISLEAVGDIDLRSTGGDVEVYGGLRVGYLPVNPYIADTLVDDVGFRMASFSGNMSNTYASFVSDSLAAGPLQDGSTYYNGNALEIWAINENGKNPSASPSPTIDGTTHFGYATTSTTGVADTNGWATPVFQVIHYAQQNLTFNPEDEDGTANPTWDQTAHWQINIDLPTYLFDQMVDEKGGNAVIGCMVMVKSPHVNTRWFTNGGGRYGSYGGEDIICYIDVSSSSATANEVHIIIDAEGGTGGTDMQAFHKDRWRIPAGDSGGDPASSVDIDVKLLLFVAAPTSGAGSIKNILP